MLTLAFGEGAKSGFEISSPSSPLPQFTTEASPTYTAPTPDRMQCLSPASRCGWACSLLDFQVRNLRLKNADHNPVSGRRRYNVRCGVSFRPCIDIHKGKVKQIVGSTLKDTVEGASALVTNFESDKSPAEFANMYKADELTGGHVIMLGADPLSKSAAIEALHAYPGGLQVGGGINSDNCMSYIEEGASHVIVTSYVFNNGRMDLEKLADLVGVVGKKRLVLDLSCRKKGNKYAIVTDRWQKFSDVFLDARVLDFLANFADEFLVHGVDVEGKKLGIDEELVALLGRHSPIPVTYAGGVTVMEDLERIKIAGMGRVDVTVGSALDIFGGNLAYDDVVAWHIQQQQLKV